MIDFGTQNTILIGVRLGFGSQKYVAVVEEWRTCVDIVVGDLICRKREQSGSCVCTRAPIICLYIIETYYLKASLRSSELKIALAFDFCKQKECLQCVGALPNSFCSESFALWAKASGAE